jgi:hypothetical protein
MASCFNFSGNIFPRTKTGVKEALLAQAIQRTNVIRYMFRLSAYGLVPAQTEPLEVFINCIFKFGLTALRVDIFNAEDKTPIIRKFCR